MSVDYANVVRGLIRSQGIEKANDAAHIMGISPSVMRLRLSQQNYTFTQILREERIAEAKALWHEGKSDLCIAAELGFDDKWLFFRNWQRWTGKSWTDTWENVTPRYLQELEFMGEQQ